MEEVEQQQDNVEGKPTTIKKGVTMIEPNKSSDLSDSSRDSSEVSEDYEDEDEYDDDEEEEEEEDDDDDDDEEESMDLSDLDIKKEDTYEVKRLKLKLLKEKAKVMDAKETIGSLVEQITAYKASVEDERNELENKLKHEKKTKLEIFEIYKDLESERDNLSKQLDIVIQECEQLEKEKQGMSKENITNLQTLMNEITNIEESNLQLEKELEKEREDNKSLTAKLQEQIKLCHRLETMTDTASTGSGSGGNSGFLSGDAAALKKQLIETQTLLAKEREKLANLDSLMFQARKLIGLSDTTGGSGGGADPGTLVEINTLRSGIMDEKQSHHKTQMMLEEEKRKADLNKKTADNLVARMRELISSHHETLQQLDDEKENGKLLSGEIEKLKEQVNNLQQQQQQQQQQQPIITLTNVNNESTNNNLLNSENTTPKTLVQSPSNESISKLGGGDDVHSVTSASGLLNVNNNGGRSGSIDSATGEEANAVNALPSPPTATVLTTNNKPTLVHQDPFVSKSASGQRMYKTIRRNQTIKYINEIGGDYPVFEKQQPTTSSSNIPNSVSSTSIASSLSNTSGGSSNHNNNNNNNNPSSTTTSISKSVTSGMGDKRVTANFGANFSFDNIINQNTGKAPVVTSNTSHPTVLERHASSKTSLVGTKGKRDKKLEKEIKEITKRIEKEEKLKKQQEEKLKKQQQDKQEKQQHLMTTSNNNSNGGTSGRLSTSGNSSPSTSITPPISNNSPKDTSHDSSNIYNSLINENQHNSSGNSSPIKERSHSVIGLTNSKDSNNGSPNSTVGDVPSYLQNAEAMGTDGQPMPGRKDTAKRKSIWFAFNK